MCRNKVFLLPLLVCLLLVFGCESGDNPVDPSLDSVKRSGVLRWGGDVVGGEPYVYEDPKNPGSYIGFEVDIAEAIARGLGVRQELMIEVWDNLIPALQAGRYDMAMNGIEDTEDRRKMVLFSDPYFVYTQQITVREENSQVHRLEDLKGKKVATLSGTAAEDILRGIPEIKVKINPEVIYSYQDLEDGRVDAVVLDTPIAAVYGAPNPKLKNVGETFGEGKYMIAFRKNQVALRDAVNSVLMKMKASGELRAIYQKWGIMDAKQASIGVE